MTNEVFDCLREAVTMAKNLNIQKVALLRSRLSALYPPEIVDEALKAWANYEVAKKLPVEID